MADLNKLVEKIKADAELKKQFSTAIKENKVVEFCKKLGIETTKEEIASFITTKKGELNEAELNAVNGGCATSSSSVRCDVISSVCSAGTLCAAVSLGWVLNYSKGKQNGSSCLA